MQKITPCLWYDDDAETAARLYAALIPGSTVGSIIRYGKAGHEIHGRPDGSVMTVDLDLGGTKIVAMNGGPYFSFTPAISLFVTLEDAAAVDRLWEGLIDGGREMMPLGPYDWSPRYGWLADRWGLTWQIALGKTAEVGRTIVPSLLFTGPQHGRAEEAMKFWTSLFEGSKVDGILRHKEGGGETADTVQHAQFHLGDDPMMVMDSGLEHGFGFNEAVSLMIDCADQAEVDRFWAALSAVPEAEACGWMKDRFGVSWQVFSPRLDVMLADPDAARRDRVMEALLTMKKPDLAALERAFAD